MVKRTLDALKALGPSLREREEAEERDWRNSLYEYSNIPGWYSYKTKPNESRMVSNASAREAWRDDNDPETLIDLLMFGREDLRSQHMTAEIIHLAGTRKLPTPKATPEFRGRRDRAIVELVHGLRRDGYSAGQAEREAASAFGVSVDLVKATWTRQDIRNDVEQAEAERQVRREPTAMG